MSEQNLIELQEQAESIVGVTLRHRSGSMGVVTRACTNLIGGVSVKITYCAAKQHHTVGGAYIWNPFGAIAWSSFDPNNGSSTVDCEIV